MTMKILVTDDVSPKGVELLKSQGFEVDVTPNLSEEELEVMETLQTMEDNRYPCSEVED